MATFTYTARKKSGEKVDGTLDVNDKRTAMNRLNQLGYVPIKVTESGTAAPKASKNGGKKSAGRKKAKPVVKSSSKFKLESNSDKPPKMKMKDTLLFTTELGDLVSSGMTLGAALKTLAARDDDSAQTKITTAMHEEITQGASLSEALAKHPNTFPPFYVNLVKAGEASGKLHESLESLVTYYEKIMGAKEKVTGALIYPVIVLVIGIGTVIFCMVWVIPKFSKMFSQLGESLPASTRMLMGISNFVIQYGLIIGAGIVAGVIFFSKWKKTEAGARTWDGILLNIPVVKRIIRANAFANFARTLGGLMNNGVPVLKAMEISEQTVGNLAIAEEVAEAREKVTDGSSISGPLAQGGVFPKLFTDMLSVGEQSGNVSGSLGHIAKRYDAELDRQIKVFTQLLEPLLMVFMAVAVGFVALSMLSAVFSMTNGLG